MEESARYEVAQIKAFSVSTKRILAAASAATVHCRRQREQA